MQIPPIEGASKVIDAYGYFPTFHDGEIVELRMLRNTTPDLNYATTSIFFTLHGWEMTSEVTPEGFFRLIKHHLIKFRFDHVDAVELDGFNHQNAILELIIESVDTSTDHDHALIHVELEPAYGLGGSFRAISGIVEEVIPCDKNGVPNSSLV